MAKPFKRKDRKLWQGTVTVGHTPGGKGIRRSVFAKTKAECQRKMDELRWRSKGQTSDDARMTFEVFLDLWLKNDASRRVKRTTLSSYEGLARKHIKPIIGKQRIENLRPIHVSQVLEVMEGKELAPSTQRHAYTVMHASLEWAVNKMDLLPSNPADKVTAPRVIPSEQSTFDTEQSLKFFKAIEGHRLQAMFLLTVATGMRQGELFGLKWRDIDFDKSELSVRRKVVELDGEFIVEEPKTAKGRRRVALPGFMVPALNDHRKRMMAEGHLEWVFCDTKGGLLRRQNMTRRDYHPILKDAGLPRIPFKNLRHTHATLLLVMGVHPKVVQERLGHSRISVTLDTYSHVLPGMQEGAAKKIDDLLSGAG